MHLLFQEIVNLRDPRIEFFVGLKGNHPRIAQAKVVLVEGELQFERLLASGLPIETVFFEDSCVQTYSNALSDLHSKGTEIFWATRELMSQIVGYRLHRGCMSLATEPSLVAIEAMDGPAVCLEGIIDPENVGSIARNCAAFGISTILLDDKSADPFLRRSIRVSMGSALFLQRARTLDLLDALRSLKSRYSIIAVDNVENSEDIESRELPKNPIFIFGNERSGVSQDVLNIADRIVRIPMHNGIVASLNVNAASAICLSKYFKQHCSQS